MVKVNPRDVESATDVTPIGWADYAFIAETENFAARQSIYPTSLGNAYLRIVLPNRPLIISSPLQAALRVVVPEPSTP